MGLKEEAATAEIRRRVGNGGESKPRQVTSGKLARRATKERAMALKYTQEDAEFMCSHTWLVLTCEIVS